MAVPYCKPVDRLKKLRQQLDKNGCDLQAWRDALPSVAQGDFALLDADSAKGWKLICGMVAARSKRMSVSQARTHACSHTAGGRLSPQRD